MFSKILVALDGSDHAHNALNTAARLATRSEAKLVLVHALQIRSLRTDHEAIVSDSVRDAYLKIGKEKADAILSHAEAEARELGVAKVKPVIKVGDPTAYIERLNLTIRQSVAYLRRRNPTHARCEKRLHRQLELTRCHYNFIRRHISLRFGRELRTPAMVAGLQNRVCSFRDVFPIAQPACCTKAVTLI